MSCQSQGKWRTYSACRIPKAIDPVLPFERMQGRTDQGTHRYSQTRYMMDMLWSVSLVNRPESVHLEMEDVRGVMKDWG